MNAENINGNDKTANSSIRNENPDSGKTVAETSDKFVMRPSTALCLRWWKFKKVNDNFCLLLQRDLLKAEKSEIVPVKKSPFKTSSFADSSAVQKSFQDTSINVLHNSKWQYSNRNKAQRRWSQEDTNKFYGLLAAMGTDFDLMSHCFPGFSRNELKRKFQYEDRKNREKVELALIDLFRKSKMEKQYVNNVKIIHVNLLLYFFIFYNNEGKMVRRARASAGCQEPESLTKAPHSFIFHRGRVGSYVRHLIGDLRKTFSPFSAAKLKVGNCFGCAYSASCGCLLLQVRKSNSLKDFVSIAGPLSVSHMLIFTRSESFLNMRLIRLPRGPTLMFRVLEYTLAKDVVSALRKSVHSKWQPNFSPLLIFNGFENDNNNVKLTHTMFQTMLPSLNVDSIKLNNIRRCVLFTYDKETEEIDFRQYAIKVVPSGVSKQAKVFLKNRVPDLGRHQDISDFFIKPQYLSESEQEGEVEGNVVELPQQINAPGCKNATEVAVRLIEMGPRLRLQLIKIEEGISNGPVLYNRFVQTSEGETNQEFESTTTGQCENAKFKNRRRRRRIIKEFVKN
ncbi:Suppressor of SWI4 1 -like protein [Trichinella spiralis]|uniref:Suppressor of SWI4 1-like protein n=1 Tax=Trichinella spiralis TaxID=6334 RepID=A0A0V1ARN8_TRISP|nr:Suppressor of SWI4 1 -like protein [Trichinella spiralis]